MDTITKKAYGKLNLALDTIGKREDSYHLVRMIMQTVDLYDVLTITKTKEPTISLTTNNGTLPTDENNLIYKAAKLLMDEFKHPVFTGSFRGRTNEARRIDGRRHSLLYYGWNCPL